MGSGRPPTPLDPASRGWFIYPRGLSESAIYKSLGSAAARKVADLVLLQRPRFEPEEHWFAGRMFTVARGQLFDSEETLACLAGTTRKVVRTVITKLIKAGEITREQVHPSGQCPHLITVLHYELSQTLPGNRASDRAIDGPEEGPRNGQRRAPSRPQEPQTPIQPQLPAPDSAWLAAHPGAAERWEAYRRQAELLTPTGGSELPVHLAGYLKQLMAEFTSEAKA